MYTCCVCVCVCAHPTLCVWLSLLTDHALLFQMGKFYELFHMDAVIAVNEMGLIYMKVNTIFTYRVMIDASM